MSGDGEVHAAGAVVPVFSMEAVDEEEPFSH